jgi:hypothetical protein
MKDFEKGTWYYIFKDGVKEHYYNHPKAPKITIDEMGFSHQRHIPAPGVYTRRRCACGIQHAWNAEGEQTFKIYQMHIATNDFGEKMYMNTKKCKKCDEILMLELEE